MTRIVGYAIATLLLIPSTAFAVPFTGVDVFKYFKDGVEIVENLDKILMILNPDPKEGLTPKVSLTFRESANRGVLQMSGGDYNADSTQTFKVEGLYWNLTFGISQLDRFGPEFVQTSGSMLHVKGPHASDDLGDPFEWALSFPETSKLKSSVTAKTYHINKHYDDFDITLFGTPDGNNLSTWGLTATGTHIPEPSTVLLTSAGFVALAFVRRNRRKP